MIENAVAVAEDCWGAVDCVKVLGLIIAAMGLYIARQQLRHKKRMDALKIKSESYDKRYAQFKAIKEFLADILQSGNSSHEKRAKLYNATGESSFLLDDEISQYIKEILKRAEQYEYKIKRRNAADDRETIERLASEEGHLFDWFVEQSKNLESRFTPYLRLEQDT